MTAPIDNWAENYLHDFGILIQEIIVEAKAERSLKIDDFSKGYRLGIYRIVSLMQEQANAFGISLDQICLADINPAQDLL